MIYDFDLRSQKSARSFLLEILGMSMAEYNDELILNCNNDPDKFWAKKGPQIQNIKLDDIRFWAFHVVASLDNCKGILTYGLKNLQKVLSSDTALNQILSSYGICFDLQKCSLIYANNNYNVNYDYRKEHCSSKFEESLKSVARRLYHDYGINGFMSNDNVFSYSSIHKCPEIIETLVSAFNELSEMKKEWENRSKSYKVSFYATIDQIQKCTFNLVDEQSSFDVEEISHIKEWMVKKAICRENGSSSQVILYIKDDVDIPVKQIMNCEKM